MLELYPAPARAVVAAPGTGLFPTERYPIADRLTGGVMRYSTYNGAPLHAPAGVARYGAVGPGFPGGSTTYVPSFQGSGNLVVGFSRNVKRFPLPRYIQIVKVPQEYFYYLRLTPNMAARVVNMRDYGWPDQQPRPRPTELETFNFIPVHTRRWSYGAQLGQLTVEQASWNVRDAHVQIIAAKGMTARTNRVVNTLTTSGFWPTNHSQTATALGGGTWDSGSSTNPYIHKGLNKSAIQIGLDTRSTVQNEDLIVVFNPHVANLMATSQEIQAYLANSYWARKVIEEGLGSNARYGFPDTIYGYRAVVDDTVYVSTLENTDSVNYAATGTYSYPDQVAVMVSRPGGLEGVFGSQSFSTFTLFCYEEFTQEQFSDQKNRLVEDFVTENTAEELTAGVSGMLVTSATTAVS